jgi:hypothetical protein
MNGRRLDSLTPFAEALWTGQEIAPIDADAAWGYLRRYVQARAPVQAEDAQDIVATAVTRILENQQRRGGSPPPSPVAYLLRTVQNTIIDHLRRQQRAVEVIDTERLSELSDEQALAAFDRVASFDKVHTALERLRRDGDTTAFQVVTFMFNTLQSEGRLPSSRETGTACHISHTAVGKAIARFKKYLLFA